MTRTYIYNPNNFSYGVQVLSNAIKGGKIGLGAGAAGGILGNATNKLSAKQGLGVAAGSSLLGAGIGALTGALGEHHRHKKLRKAGVKVTKDGLATIKDKDGTEYNVSIQPHGKRTKGGMYVNSPELPKYSKNLINRLKFYKAAGIDLPKNLKESELLLLEPKDLHYDPELMKSVALHEVGHQKNKGKSIKNQQDYEKMRQSEEADADRYSVEHGGNAKAMIKSLEETYDKMLKKDPRYRRMTPDQKKETVRKAIMQYRGDYLYKQAGHNFSNTRSPKHIYTYKNFARRFYWKPEYEGEDNFLDGMVKPYGTGNIKAMIAKPLLTALMALGVSHGMQPVAQPIHKFVDWVKAPAPIEKQMTVDNSNGTGAENSYQNQTNDTPQLSLNNLPPEVQNRIVKNKITQPNIPPDPNYNRT